MMSNLKHTYPAADMSREKPGRPGLQGYDFVYAVKAVLECYDLSELPVVQSSSDEPPPT